MSKTIAADPRVTVETRKAYTIIIGSKKRRFWTEASAYYKLAASLLGQKYLAAFKAYESESGAPDLVAKELGISVERLESRADRAQALFCADRYDSEGGYAGYFDTDRWQKYVRRVAGKMRAMDRIRAADQAEALGEGGE